MGFWERLLGFLTKGQGVEDPMVYWVYARCEKCGEPLRVRVNLRNDLSAQFGEGREGTTYFCRKVIVGSGKCYNSVEVRLAFDARRNLVKREIEGGAFLTAEEYESQMPESSTSSQTS